MKYVILLITVFSLISFSQFRDDALREDPKNIFLSPSSGNFLDMNRLSVSHSVSMGYYSGGKRSVLLNEYTAGIKYKISEPLTLRMDLGLSYTPYSSFSPASENQPEILLRSASLDYSPNESFRMRIDFVNTPSYYDLKHNPFGSFPENNR